MDIEFYVHPEEWSPGPCVGEAADIVTDLRGSLAASMAMEWLHRCQEEHSICQRSDGALLPRRVIDVGLLDGSRDPRLIETDETVISPPLPYTALSYCWGSQGNLMTTSSTIAQRKAGFPLDSLPKTFQDAIAITRHLGARYIWIDALCIIQDNHADWETGAASMASIYEGSYLTISVTRASDVKKGFLGTPNNSIAQFAGHMIPYPDTGQGLRHVFVRKRIPHSSVVPEAGATEGCPLLSRGWALQERLLATRTLHFLPQEVLWECRCQFWCECMRVGADLSWKPRSMQGSLYNQTMSNPAEADLTALWRLIIQDYTKERVTLTTDRLPALSGIAHKFQDLGTGEYLAGPWEIDLFWNLAWQADHSLSRPTYSNSATSPISAKCQALKPSLSWISSSLPVRYRTHDMRIRGPTDRRTIAWNSYGNPSLTDTKIIRAECEYAGQDSMGHVESGSLVLYARVTLTTVRNRGKTYTLWKNYDDGTSATLIPDSDLGEASLSVGDSVWCMHLFTYRKGGGPSHEDKWTGLAVVPVGQRFADTRPGLKVTAVENTHPTIGPYECRQAVPPLGCTDEKYCLIGLVEGAMYSYRPSRVVEDLRRKSSGPY